MERKLTAILSADVEGYSRLKCAVVIQTTLRAENADLSPADTVPEPRTAR